MNVLLCAFGWNNLDVFFFLFMQPRGLFTVSCSKVASFYKVVQ